MEAPAQHKIVEYVVKIPNDDGTAFIEEVPVKIPVEVDEHTGELILGDEAQQIIDDTRARHMGLMLPKEIKRLREDLKLTQAEMALRLQAGEKSYARWENGRGRQSRLVNNYLTFLRDGKISLSDLSAKIPGNFVWSSYAQFVGKASNRYMMTGGSLYAFGSYSFKHLFPASGTMPLISTVGHVSEQMLSGYDQQALLPILDSTQLIKPLNLSAGYVTCVEYGTLSAAHEPAPVEKSQHEYENEPLAA